MKTKLLFLITIITFVVIPQSQLQADGGLISSVYYETSPPVERGAKQKVKKKHKRKFIKKRKQKRDIKRTKEVNKPGFLVMIVLGLALAVLAIYLGTLMAAWGGVSIPSGGCMLVVALATTLTVIIWMFYIVLVIAALALLVLGIIFFVYLNSPAYKAKKKRRERETADQVRKAKEILPNITKKDAVAYMKNKEKISKAKDRIKVYKERGDRKSMEKVIGLEDKIRELEFRQKEIETRSR